MKNVNRSHFVWIYFLPVISHYIFILDKIKKMKNIKHLFFVWVNFFSSKLLATDSWLSHTVPWQLPEATSGPEDLLFFCPTLQWISQNVLFWETFSKKLNKSSLRQNILSCVNCFYSNCFNFLLSCMHVAMPERLKWKRHHVIACYRAVILFLKLKSLRCCFLYIYYICCCF